MQWAASIAVADRRNRWRLLVMAIGIALCALALLAIASINPMINSIIARGEAAQPTTANAGQTFEWIDVANTLDGKLLSGTLLAGAPGSTPPPGTARFPADGELLVSPALAEALADPAQTTLRALISGTVVGQIDPSVLTGPGEWAYYRGVSVLPGSTAQQATGWGPANGAEREPVTSLYSMDSELWTILVTGVVILLVPLLLFTALAGRIGAARRDRRSAVLRLLGASSTQLRLVVVAEAVLASAAGLLIAVLTYLGTRSVVPFLDLGRGVQATDLRPDTTAAIVIALSVPVLASAAALSGARQARVSPLGPVRSVDRRTRVVWRLALLLLTVAATTAVIHTSSRFGSYDIGRLCFLIVLDILCVAAFVGPVTQALVRSWRGGGPVFQLTRGRLINDPAASTRSAAAQATVLASLLGLMSLLSARGEVTEQRYGPGAADGLHAYSGYASDLSVTDFQRLEASLKAVPGVVSVNMSAALPMTASNADATLATCDQVMNTTAPQCRDGDVIGLLNIAPTEAVRFTVQGGRGSWSPPATTLNTRLGPEYGGTNSYLLTPAALAEQLPQITALSLTTVSVWMPPSAYPAALDATAWLGWQRDTLLTYQSYSGNDIYSLIRVALLVGAAIVLLICALAQWLLAAEYVNDRRRSFALARASGVPTRVLGRSVILGALIPVGVGIILATGVGALLAWEIKYLRGGDPVPLDWKWLALSAGTAATVTLLIGLGSALQLRRTTDPAALRTE